MIREFDLIRERFLGLQPFRVQTAFIRLFGIKSILFTIIRQEFVNSCDEEV